MTRTHRVGVENSIGHQPIFASVITTIHLEVTRRTEVRPVVSADRSLQGHHG